LALHHYRLVRSLAAHQSCHISAARAYRHYLSHTTIQFRSTTIRKNQHRQQFTSRHTTRFTLEGPPTTCCIDSSHASTHFTERQTKPNRRVAPRTHRVRWQEVQPHGVALGHERRGVVRGQVGRREVARIRRPLALHGQGGPQQPTVPHRRGQGQARSSDSHSHSVTTTSPSNSSQQLAQRMRRRRRRRLLDRISLKVAA
ncbi:hypothetical protein GNI_191490, partial [Gregarina niphandrodes]